MPLNIARQLSRRGNEDMPRFDLRNQLHVKVKDACRKVGIKRDTTSPVLVQEEAGIHVGISADLPEAAAHAAKIMHQMYQEWLQRGRFADWGVYKRQHFSVAVGGGNTLKAQYRAMVDSHHSDIDWIEHVRFFFLEESSGERNWESAENSLVINFIVPLAQKMIASHGLLATADKLELGTGADQDDIIDRMIATMVNPINLAQVKQALDSNKAALATRLARSEAQRYQQDIQHKLGASMEFHYIMSGIGKKGTLGAFAPYTAELKITEPGVLVLKQGKSAMRVALNRGVLTNAGNISLIVAGNLKLRALGRFEMEESADFEQTVMETPLRMLRETRQIAEKVYIFADEQSLHFDETLFQYSERGVVMQNKAETREGEEENGAHILLLHGFMGLFSFTSFLVRLPSAWTVSALHRGSHAKTLPDGEIFPHYARVLRKAMLKIWRQGRPVPIAGHSIAGVISDHLLLSILDDYEAPIRPYEGLAPENRELVDAMRASGIVHLASWAPTDGPHTGENIKRVIAHYREKSELDYSGFERTYDAAGNELQVDEAAAVTDDDSLAGLGKFLDSRLAEPMVNSLNSVMRLLLNNKTVQQRMLNTNSPYVLRLVGNRLLKTASFYGLAKEVNAALHDPVEYQRRHLKALDIILAYDIPFLSIIHQDDFLVSAKRHREEHNYLVSRRKKKEGVSREDELQVPARYIMLRREQDALPVDPLNPHLLIMATSTEGNNMARQITAAMTRFVNENLARAVQAGQLKPLPSVRKWQRENKPAKPRRKSRVA
jgi:6-phosphogluconolactonase/glucosamine-6-phosphate isomerase/deaminase